MRWYCPFCGEKAKQRGQGEFIFFIECVRHGKFKVEWTNHKKVKEYWDEIFRKGD